MFNKRVGETLQNGCTKCPVVLSISDGGDNLLEDALLQKSRYFLILQALTNSLQTVQTGTQYHRSMSTIQNTHFSLLIRIYIVCPYNIKACLLQRKLVLMIALDYPQMEDFSGIHHVILLTDTLAQSCMLISRESGYNTVYQCRAEIIFILQPCLKIIAQVPQICILLTALQQFLTIVVNQLTRKDNKARQSQLESLIKQLSQLARERMSRSILKLVITFKANTCLSGIGNDKAEIRVLSQKLKEKELFDGSVVIVQPIEKGMCEMLEKQGCEYNLFLRGINDGKFVDEHTHIDVIYSSFRRCPCLLLLHPGLRLFLRTAENPSLL